MADASDSKSDSGNWVSVRPRPPLPKEKDRTQSVLFFVFKNNESFIDIKKVAKAIKKTS